MDTRVASQQNPPRDLPEHPGDQWLQAIFGQAAVGIAVINGEGHFLHCNQKLAQITGRGVADLIGHKCSEITHQDDWPASQAMLADLRSGLRTEFIAEKRYLRPDGAPVWVRALQAGIVGIAAGLVLHLLLSLVVLHGKELWSRPPAPATCKKSAPARESGTPANRPTPSVSVRPAAVAGVRG